jgi:hypothetical protein
MGASLTLEQTMSEESKEIIPVMTATTDPAVIASIQANGYGDVLGFKSMQGTWWAEHDSLQQWRETQDISGVHRQQPEAAQE